MSEKVQTRHFDHLPVTLPVYPEQRTSSARPGWSGSWPGTDITTHKLGVGFLQRSLHIKLQPLLGSHLFGPRLIDIGSNELVQRPEDLVVLVGTTLGSFAG
jgi:hypothetical protein